MLCYLTYTFNSSSANLDRQRDHAALACFSEGQIEKKFHSRLCFQQTPRFIRIKARLNFSHPLE